MSFYNTRSHSHRINGSSTSSNFASTSSFTPRMDHVSPLPAVSPDHDDRDVIMMVTCTICQVTVDSDYEAFQLVCGHQFCCVCLKDRIENDFNSQGEVTCPQARCGRNLDDFEISYLLGDEVKFNEFQQKMQQIKSNLAEAMQQDEMLAAELQNEDKTFIVNKDEFDCKICLVDIPPGDGVTIKSCRHSFCKECLVEYIKTSDDVEIKCPFNDAGGNICGRIITEREMRGFVPTDILEKHNQKSLTLYEATSAAKTLHCLKPDCPGFVESEDPNLRGFMCYVCAEINCVQCEAIHTGKTCAEYHESKKPDAARKRMEAEAEKAFQAYVAKGEAMHCPQCRLAIVKGVGCDYLQCPTCKLGICWVTKKPRQPLHKPNGEVIDGCHCRERGRLCHPKCGNCH